MRRIGYGLKISMVESRLANPYPSEPEYFSTEKFPPTGRQVFPLGGRHLLRDVPQGRS